MTQLQSKRLSDIVKVVARFTAPSSQADLAALTHLRLQKEGTNLIISGGDLDTWAKMVCPCDDLPGTDWDLLVPARLFASYLETLDGDLTLDTDEDHPNTLVVHCGKHRARFRTIEGEEFPNYSIPPEAVVINAGQLKALIQHTVYAAGVDDTRPVLTGVRLAVSEGIATAAAVDGFRLATYEVPRFGEATFTAIVPAAALRRLVELMGRVPDDEGIGVHYSDGGIGFSTPEWYMGSGLLAGTFPNYATIIPKEIPYLVEIELAELRAALKTVHLFCDDAHMINWTFSGGALELTAESSENGRARAVVSYTDYGPSKVEQLITALSWPYVDDQLKHTTGPFVYMAPARSTPNLFKDKDGNHVSVIMPMQRRDPVAEVEGNGEDTGEGDEDDA